MVSNVATLAGVLLLVAGVAMLLGPAAAMIVAGLLLLGVGYEHRPDVDGGDA